MDEQEEEEEFSKQNFRTTQEEMRRRQWHPTPVLLPGESQGRGSLVGCHLWGRTESDTTEATQQQEEMNGSSSSKY